MKKRALITVVVLCLMLGTPIFSSAASGTKYLSLVMSDKDGKESISIKCYNGLVKGGALAGGEGIDYQIYFKIPTASDYAYLRNKTQCKPNTDFPPCYYETPVEGACTLTLLESQHKSSNPGIGWGRIDYELDPKEFPDGSR